MKKVRKATISLDFPYSDLGDEYAGSVFQGPEGEKIVFDVSKGAGSVHVDVFVNYGRNPRDYDEDYFEKMFDSVLDSVNTRYDGQVMRSAIEYSFKKTNTE